MITNIPFEQLSISGDNVRVVSTAKNSDKQLIASMQARGILQNLVVNRTESPDRYEVIAGGRRFAAAGVLVKKGVWDEDVELPCRINEDDDTTAVSLSENLHEAMHPADEFMSYQAMANNGLSEKTIALEFGVSSAHVKKRLRLASVAPKIVQDFRKGKLGIEEVMAFTVETDQDNQLHCYKELGNHLYPHSIRNFLLHSSEASDSRLCQFVGLAAYKKAGGSVSTDLFESQTHLHDMDLLQDLAMQKLKKSAATIEKEGWNSLECSLDGFSAGSTYCRAEPELVGVPAALEKKIKSLDSAIAKMEDDDEDWTDEKNKKFDDLEKQLDECELKKESYQQYTEEQKSKGHCIVTFDHKGELLVLRGLLSKADNKKLQNSSSGQGVDQGDDELNETSPLPRTLLSDLALYKRQIVQAELARDTKLALDLLHFSLCAQVLDELGYLDSAIDVRATVTSENTTLMDLDNTVAAVKLNEQFAKLDTAWLSVDDDTERFELFRQLSAKAKASLVAYCTARVFANGRSANGQYVSESMEIDYAAYWRPASDNFFKRLTIDALLALAKDWFGDQWVDDHKKNKKTELVQHFHDFFNGGQDKSLSDDLVHIRDTWLPVEF
ncbi:MAG: ParB/RepB/Spo0J family partition protein [Gammaproteobacteria bacterium]|nr:ParB/RepB/Spo0J family partition protein [Gammaproteobacteria bacterium]